MEAVCLECLPQLAPPEGFFQVCRDFLEGNHKSFISFATLILTYKYKLKPNATQKNTFEWWLGVCRYVYNLALEHRITSYQSGTPVGRFDQYNQFVECKREFPWLSEVHSEVTQETLDRVDNAYQKFFKGAGFPKWAKKDEYRSFTFKRSVSVQGDFVKLPKIGLVRFYNSRTFRGKIKYVNIVKEIDSWYVCFCVEQPSPIQSSENQAVGIDMGVARLASLSSGSFFENPRHFNRFKKALRLKQRKLARQKRGSKSRLKTKCQLTKLHQKIRRCRTDYLHKVSTQITGTFNKVYVEDLKLNNMTKSAKGTVEKPGKNVRQKTGLNRSLNDAGIGQFLTMLEYKALRNGGEFIRVNPAYTSQTCSDCGYKSPENRESQSLFVCKSCGERHNADTNASKNILALGKSLSTQRGALARACA